MAVENCTISTQSITALGGSTLVAGTKTLIITPDAGFEVSAAQCSVGNAMETFNGSNTWNTVGANVTTGITQVQFADVGDGTVEAIVTHGAISISNNTTDFLVDIDVSAAVPPSFACALIEVRHNSDTDGAIMSTSQFSNIDSITEVEVINIPALHQVTSSGEVNSTAGTITQIAKVRVNAVAGVIFGVNDDGLPSVSPTLSGMGGLQPNWSTTYTNLIYDGDFLTQFDVDVFYETPINNPNGIESANDFCDLNHKISIRVKSSKIPTARAMSYSVDGFNAELSNDYHAGNRDITVFGTPGSRFNVGVVDEDGKKYDFNRGVFSYEIKQNVGDGYFSIPSNGRFKTSIYYPSSKSAAKSYSYFVEGVTTPAKASVGGEFGRTANLIEAGVTSLGSSVPTRTAQKTEVSKPRQTVLLKVTQSASEHGIASASATGVSLFGTVNEVPKKIINIPDLDIPYVRGLGDVVSKVDFSFTVTLGGSKAYAATGASLTGGSLRYVTDTNTVTSPTYFIRSGTITSTYSASASAVFAGTFYVSSFGDVNGDGVYQLEIYLDNFIKAA